MPRVSELLANADAHSAQLAVARAAAAAARADMPQPSVRRESTLLEGWLFKGSFNLAGEEQSQVCEI